MKLIAPALVFMTAIWFAQAMDSDNESEDRQDLYSIAPQINLTDATVTRAQEHNIIIFDALFPAGNQIIVQQHTDAQSTHKYVGEHLFTSPKGSQLGDDLSPKHAHKLFEECAALHTTQTEKTALLQTTQ